MTKQDRVWFITGASAGFGQALAQAVIERGERAVVAARRRERLAELQALAPDRVLPLALDVTDPAARQAGIDQALARFGRVDVLANIAGRGSLGAVEEFAPDQLRDQMELNFFAAAEMTRATLPAMRAQGAGHILNLTSIGGLISIGGFGPYCASKFALEAWTEALADEVAAFGIHATLVEPGNFRTEFAGDVNMRPKAPIEAYRPVIAPIEEFLYGQAGRQPGDPAKAAAAMIAVVDDPNPPRRLILGPDAYEVLDRTYAARTADIARYREMGEGTNYPDAEVRAIGVG
ncbi:MAG: SDR family NAD(P)-dependent oxidoreductase [Caulobacterales bacterium]|nr:SDR family NAD(P)-dependent oxidoreductase [Caulobacterales bacterium]